MSPGKGRKRLYGTLSRGRTLDMYGAQARNVKEKGRYKMKGCVKFTRLRRKSECREYSRRVYTSRVHWHCVHRALHKGYCFQSVLFPPPGGVVLSWWISLMKMLLIPTTVFVIWKRNWSMCVTVVPLSHLSAYVNFGAIGSVVLFFFLFLLSLRSSVLASQGCLALYCFYDLENMGFIYPATSTVCP
jgi:hypothetical protein